MATTIDKSVNWRNAVTTPEYQVAARPVDTYVRPAAQSNQLAKALEQTAGVVNKIGEQQAAAKLEKQRAALETTNGLIQQDIDSGAIKKLEESQDWLSLPETLRIESAQTIGKADSISDYEAMRQGIYDNPDLVMTDEALEQHLATFSVTIDGEDGYSIHRQSAHRRALEDYKIRVREEASGMRRVEHKKEAVASHELHLKNVLHDTAGLSAKERHDALFAVSTKGLLPSDQRANYYKVLEEYVTSTKDLSLLNNDVIPKEMQNPAYNYLRRELEKKMAKEVEGDTRYAEWKKQTERTEHEYQTTVSLNQMAIDGQEIILDDYRDDPVAYRIAQSVLESSIMDSTESATNLVNFTDEITRRLQTGKDINYNVDGTSQTVARTVQGITAFVNTLPLTPKDKQTLLKSVPTLLETGDITRSAQYRQAFELVTPIVNENAIKETFLVNDDEVEPIAAQMLDDLRETYRELYNDRLLVNGSIGYDQHQFIKKALQERASELIETFKRKNTSNVDSAASLAASLAEGGGNTDTVDNVATNEVESAEEPFDASLLTPELLKDLQPYVRGLDLTAIEDLTPEQLVEAYGSELAEAFEMLSKRQATEQDIKDWFTKLPQAFKEGHERQKKINKLTPAQRDYYDRTGKFPNE